MARLPGGSLLRARVGRQHSRVQRKHVVAKSGLPTQCSHTVYNTPRPLRKSNCRTAESAKRDGNGDAGCGRRAPGFGAGTSTGGRWIF